MPGAPLVHNQLHLVLLIKFAHGQPVLGDQRFHDVSLPEQLVPVVRSEVDRLALAGRPTVVMHRQAVETVEHTLAFGG